MKKIISPVAVACVIAVSFTQTGCKSGESKKGVGISLADIDSTVQSGNDFFSFANGGWIKANPIPADQVRWGSFGILSEENKKNLHQIAEDASKKSDAKKGSPEQLVGDFFFSAMDTVNIEKLGATPIKAEMESIDKISDMKSLMAMVAKMQMWNASPMFNFGAGQDPKNS